MKLSKKLKKGFTLVELVVVIAIIAILSGVSVAVYVGITDNAKKSAASQEAEQVSMVVRAAALMSADGYTEQYSENVEQTKVTKARYHVDWTSDGLKITILDTDGTTSGYGTGDPVKPDQEKLSANEVIKDIFEEVEKAKFPGKSIVVKKTSGTEQVAIGDILEGADTAAVAVSFEYTTSSDYSASASFVA